MPGIQIPIGVNLDPLRKGAAQVRGILDRELGGTLSGLTRGLGVAGLAAGMGYLAKESVKLAMNMEQLQVAFTTILGSGGKATQLLADIQKMATATPFETLELADAAKSLVAFGVGSENVVTTLTRLGDLASGLNIPLGEMADLYGKMKVQNRIFAEDINQLTGRGIPIIAELAKQFGVAEEKIKEMVKEGEVGFANLEKAVVSMTSEGGKFNNMMENQSKTMQGQLSTLKDEFKVLGLELGEQVLPVLKEMVTTTTDWVRKLKEGKDSPAGNSGGISGWMKDFEDAFMEGEMPTDIISLLAQKRHNRANATEKSPFFSAGMTAPESWEAYMSKKRAAQNEDWVNMVLESEAEAAAERAANKGKGGSSMPGADFLKSMVPAILEEAARRATKKKDDMVAALFGDTVASGSGMAIETSAGPRSVIDQMTTSLARIGGARGIGPMAARGMESLQKTANDELRQANVYLAKLAEDRMAGSYT